MNWIILIVAGLCECAFTFCLGCAKEAHGWAYALWITGFGLFTIASMTLLMKATQAIPIGTAYPVWTGIGAVGTVVLGVLVFHEPITLWRLFFLSTLIISIVGLKLLA